MRSLTWWDNWFIKLAEHISTASKDPSTQCGAVIVRPDKTICSMGYNGFPRGMADTEERINNREDKSSRVIHAEVNAILSSRENLKGYTIYTWPFLTCDRCSTVVIQAGITRVVSMTPTENQLLRWGKSFSLAKSYYEEAGIMVDEYEKMLYM